MESGPDGVLPSTGNFTVIITAAIGFFPDVTLSATALAAGIPLRHGDTGGFCVVMSPEQLAALKPLLTDDAGDSLDERWSVSFFEGTTGDDSPHASSVED